MEGATSGGVEAGDLSKVGMVLDCRVSFPLAIVSAMRQRHRVRVRALVLICGVRKGLTFCAEEFAGDVDAFTADDDNLLAVEQLLCHCACQAAEQVSFAVHHDLKDDMLAFQ
jgi:hypothetical protein